MSEIDQFLDQVDEEHRELFRKHVRVPQGFAMPKQMPAPKPHDHTQGLQVMYSPDGAVVGAKTESYRWLILSPKKLLAEWFSLAAAGAATISEPKWGALATLLGALWVFTKHRHHEISARSAELVVQYWQMSQGGRREVSEEKLATEFAAGSEDCTVQDAEKIIQALLDMGLFKITNGDIILTERLVRMQTV